MKALILFFFSYVFINSAQATSIETLKLETPRGEEIDAVIHYPDSESPLPAVVIGSGQGYHMDRPLTKGLAEKVAKKGYVAIRFNWHYFSQGSKPSQGFKDEQEDFATVVKFAKSNQRIDSKKIIVAGKSLGTVIAYRHFESDPSIRALVLMTPICTSRWDESGNERPEPVPVGKMYYPNLVGDTRSAVIAMGNRDSLCSIPMMYDFLRNSSGNIASVIVEGDHGMNIGKWDDPTYKDRNSENIEAALDMISHWVRLIVNNF